MEDPTKEDVVLATVRAQMMVRDDYLKGWFPVGSGGLSTVTIVKRPTQDDQAPYAFYIIGVNTMTNPPIHMSCGISKDFEYNKVIPTFYHWKSYGERFGLTFKTAADGRAFDRGMKTAFRELILSVKDRKSIRIRMIGKFPEDNVSRLKR